MVVHNDSPSPNRPPVALQVSTPECHDPTALEALYFTRTTAVQSFAIIYLPTAKAIQFERRKVRLKKMPRNSNRRDDDDDDGGGVVDGASHLAN